MLSRLIPMQMKRRGVEMRIVLEGESNPVPVDLPLLKVLMGAERRSMVMSNYERRKVAYHESGHALVAALQKGGDPLHKVTTIPRGMALGVTQQLPLDDRYTHSRQYLDLPLLWNAQEQALGLR